MKDKYHFKEDLANSQSKWTTTEGGIQYLRELAMVEVTCKNLDDEQVSKNLDEIQCMLSMWQKVIRNVLTLYTHTLAIISWTDSEAPTIDEVVRALRV